MAAAALLSGPARPGTSMPNLRNRYPARRRFLKQSAALTATVSLAAPLLVVAQTAQPAASEPQPAASGQDSARKRSPAR